MKINGNIEICGMNQVVLNRHTVFERGDNGYWFYVTCKGAYVWVDGRTMTRKIQQFIDSEHYRVWTHESAINVVSKRMPDVIRV
jgi:hypothetical protein